jgi:rod shape-determining protein MreC
MNKVSKFASVILILFAFILLQNNIISFLGNIASLFRENNQNSLEITAYKEKIESLEKELADYQSTLNNLEIYNDNEYILSKIAIRNMYDFYDYLIVSTDSMVTTGAPVINEDGLVGIVESRNKKTAKIKLITSSSISVKVSSSYGQLDEYDKQSGLLIIHNINNYKEINEGDEVLTSGLTEIVEGIPIGTVQKVEKKGIEQVVYVKPFADFDNLNYLYVINS